MAFLFIVQTTYEATSEEEPPFATVTSTDVGKNNAELKPDGSVTTDDSHFQSGKCEICEIDCFSTYIFSIVCVLLTILEM